VRQQARPRQPLVDRLVGLLGDLDLRLAVALIAPLDAGLAGVLVADVLEHLEAGGEIFELLGDFLADAAAFQPAAGAQLLFGLKVMFDGDARQRLGQLRPPVLVLDATSLEHFAGFTLHRRLIDSITSPKSSNWVGSKRSDLGP
jgi:hypothetical protein